MANVLGELFGAIASAIREKTGDAETMKPAEFPEKISGIETGADVSGVTAAATDVLEGKTIVDAQGNAVDGAIKIHKDLVQTVPLPLYATNWAAEMVNRTQLEGYYTNYAIEATSVGLSITPTKSYQKKTALNAGAFFHEVRISPIPDEYQDVTGVTATAEDVRAGKVFVDSSGTEITGALAIPEVSIDGETLVISGSSTTIENETLIV